MLARWSDTADSLKDLMNLQNEMNRLFYDYTDYEGNPAVNIWSKQDELIVTAELPGINVEEANITAKGDILTIEGQYSQDGPKEEDVVYHRNEREEGQFLKNVRLPFQVDTNKISANYQNGVLKIILPRSEESKPKKIEVKTE